MLAMEPLFTYWNFDVGVYRNDGNGVPRRDRLRLWERARVIARCGRSRVRRSSC